ncbi:hypothetical protein ALC62_07074 [Cyphomyrmex costatus]|uniref:Uncharacterized protein n=1 Tax=Cyphomyrmex costatus TaxID=456900 RepID=A0A195CPP6_9HYME|nr:hypothetical protein ALC62_07074 [Cyphomyrmex costatus]
MARRRRRVTARVSIRPSDKRLLDSDDPRSPVARLHATLWLLLGRPVETKFWRVLRDLETQPSPSRNPEYIEQGLRFTTTLEQRSLDSSKAEAICFALICFYGVTHVKMRSCRQRERTTSAIGAIFVFVYTEDMYKMMRDTNRQLEDNIGPAVPVCIASGRSPVIQRHPG